MRRRSRSGKPDCRVSGRSPEMLPLVNLTAEEIDKIVSRAPGGRQRAGCLSADAAAGRDSVPSPDGRRTRSVPARDAVGVRRACAAGRICPGAAGRDRPARHFADRGAVGGISEPVQVVYREARLPVEEVELDAGSGDAAEQLYARFHPRRFHMDVRQAPLLRLYIAYDAAHRRWLMMLLLHHLAMTISPLRRCGRRSRRTCWDRSSAAAAAAIPQPGGQERSGNNPAGT